MRRVHQTSTELLGDDGETLTSSRSRRGAVRLSRLGCRVLVLALLLGLGVTSWGRSRTTHRMSRRST